MRESLKYTLYAVLRFSWGLYFVLCIQSGIETPMQLYNDQIIQITGSYLVLFIFGMFALLVQFMNRKKYTRIRFDKYIFVDQDVYIRFEVYCINNVVETLRQHAQIRNICHFWLNTYSVLVFQSISVWMLFQCITIWTFSTNRMFINPFASSEVVQILDLPMKLKEKKIISLEETAVWIQCSLFSNDYQMYIIFFAKHFIVDGMSVSVVLRAHHTPFSHKC